jgi:hypothetical protein
MGLDIKAILVGAALGAVTTKAMGDGFGKGAAAGAVVAAFGPWVNAKLAMSMAPAAAAAPAAPTK